MFNLDVLFSVSNIILFIAIITRISGMLASAPLFSTYPIPRQGKIWLAALIAFILFPIVQYNSNFATPTNVPMLTIILFKEYLVGYTMGFCANLIFTGIELGVNMFAIQMGLSASQALNPVSGGTSPVITRAYTYLASMIFIALSAHQWLFAALYNSFKSIPIGYTFTISPAIVDYIINLTGQLFNISLGIALPIFGVLFITDVLLGFTSKMMPQMNIFMVSMPLKIY
jgi:flagellar biosynthetic protein FliR